MSALSLLDRKSYLRHVGWFKSIFLQRPVTSNDQPIPWYTYSCLHFLEPRIDSSWSVFEWGAGNSTLWWAARVKFIRTIEHDKLWYKAMQQSVPENVALSHSPADNRFEEAIAQHAQRYDVIIIDGKRRVECAKLAPIYLNDGGVIIWDNSDRNDYKTGFLHLQRNGFRQLPFRGLGPSSRQAWETSIFYRDGNCLAV